MRHALESSFPLLEQRDEILDIEQIELDDRRMPLEQLLGL